jgi:fido (protein-threonine AMPylation protein)
MKARPGQIMGYLAYGHPFLDGYGRTIMTVHSALAQRAGFSIDWTATKTSVQRRQRGRRQCVAAREHHHIRDARQTPPGAPARPG